MYMYCSAKCHGVVSQAQTIFTSYKYFFVHLFLSFLCGLSWATTLRESTNQEMMSSNRIIEVGSVCLTLWDPNDHSPSGSSVRGILQARTPEWVVISFSRGSFLPRDRTRGSYVSCWQVGSLLLAPPEKIMLRRKREGIKEKFTLN